LVITFTKLIVAPAISTGQRKDSNKTTANKDIY